MFQQVTKLTTILALLALGACNRGTSGSEGNLIFADNTQTVPPDFSGDIDQALAVGARMVIDVDLAAGNFQPRRDADIDVASSSDLSVFDVESYSAGRVVLEGVGEGRAFLDVVTQTGTTDSIGVSVNEIVTSEIILLPWPAIFELPDSLWSNGAALLPNSPTDVFVMRRDGDGDDLTGFGAGTWEMTADAETGITPLEGTDFATVRTGPSVESYTVTTTAGGSLDLQTVDEPQVTRLGIFNFTDGSGPFFDGDTMQVDEGRSYLLHLVAYTDDDLYVIGAGEVPMDAIVPSEGAFYLRVTLEPGSEENSDDLNRMIGNGRAFFVDAIEYGDTELTVDWVEQTVTIDVEVLFDADPPEEEEPEEPEEPEES